MNFLGRFISANMVDNLSIKLTYGLIMLLQIVVLIFLQINNQYIYCILSTIMFLTYGAHFVQIQVFYGQL